MRGRGRLIECPECGTTFKGPAFAERRYGVAISVSRMGDFTCPKCKYKASTSSFRYVDEEAGSDPNKKDSQDKTK